jgi:hypothetical protein
MYSEREVHADVRNMLITNQPFRYAHLIKFERPSRPDARTGRSSTSASSYAYLTDASVDVDFDDQSKDLQGNANGIQHYVANKVLSVSSIQETTAATASNCTITLDANGLGAQVTASITIQPWVANYWDVFFPANIDLTHAGFREGDKIDITFSPATQTQAYSFTIFKFRAGNALRVMKIKDDMPHADGNPINATVALSSEEIKSILLDKNSPNYASFINREVFIYRAYFQNGQMVGATPDANGYLGPLLLFRGIINNVSFDDGDGGIQVSWGLTSHWGDFAQVKGRITSDEFHRALDANGIPQPDSAIKPIYAYDKGFAHADTSVNLLAHYTVMVESQDVKAKNGFFGIGAKTKVTTVKKPEDRTTNLDINLQSKAIPVIYGVRAVDGIPIFADTLLNDSSTVYVIYALSEGEVGAIYDILIDDKSLICNNQEDFDARSTQTTDGTVDLICRGRADRGDVLGGSTAVDTTTVVNYYDTDALKTVWNLVFNKNAVATYNPYTAPVEATANLGKGIIAGESISLTSPNTMTMDFFSGTENQKAASQLVDIAKANNFKVQNDYWTGSDTSEYWGPNHRLFLRYRLRKVKQLSLVFPSLCAVRSWTAITMIIATHTILSLHRKVLITSS